MKNNLSKKIYSKKSVSRIDQKIKLLGDNIKIDAYTFLNARLLFSALVFIAFLLMNKIGYLLAPIIAILSYVCFEHIVLDIPIKKRSKKLEKEAIFFFEVLTLTLESGRNLRHALDLTTKNVDSEISLEFQKTLSEVKLGKSLNEALESLKLRIPSETINNALLSMIECNTFGSSILDSMYNQIEFLRDKQLLDVKAEIAKLPTKVSLISVLFFIPIMLLIILAPVLINYITK